MTRAVTLCLAALALVAAGCGGDDDGGGGLSKEEYEQQVGAAGDTLEETFGDLGTSISGSGSAEQAAKELEEGADALDRAAGDLGDIEPPSEIEEQHDQVVEGLSALADEFREGAEAAEEGDLEGLLAFAQDLQGSDAVQKITEAGQEIEEKGFDFSGADADDGGGGQDGGDQ